MRPAHVFAKHSAADELQIVALLQGPWRFALRLVMIWLSLRGLTASEIATLFEYDPHTVRRWINRYNAKGVAGLEDRPRSGAPRLGSAGLGRRIRMLLREPGGLDGQATVACAGPPGDVAGDPGPASPRAGQLAPAAAGGEGRPRRGQRPGGAPCPKAR